jgi:hypothetical protein
MKRILFVLLTLLYSNSFALESSVSLKVNCFTKEVTNKVPVISYGAGYSIYLTKKINLDFSLYFFKEKGAIEGLFGYVGTPDTNLYYGHLNYKKNYFIPELCISYSLFENEKFKTKIGLGEQLLCRYYYSSTLDVSNNTHSTRTENEFLWESIGLIPFIKLSYFLNPNIHIDVQPYTYLNSPFSDGGITMAVSYVFK